MEVDKVKILWLTNIPLPEASLLMNEKPLPFGGWLVNASSDLSENDEIDLHITFPVKGISGFKQMEGEKINYYAFSPIDTSQASASDQVDLDKIIKKVNPDLVHIFGTEYAHSLAMVNLCNDIGIKTIVSIQGLTSIYSRHYMANLPIKVQKRFTIRDLIKRENLIVQKKNFEKRGELEVETIKRTKHVIGRTTWDKACTSQINPRATYHFCNETLREEFYKHMWGIDQCERFSIFTSQASYPIKGIHFVLEAMPLILKRFPQTKLYIAGQDITKADTIKQKIKLSSYAKYIRDLIKEYKLEDSVIFTGLLDEKQMCERYLKSNVFVCPSSIENSPNSLGEAMILGVPSVASYVGGIPDMLNDKKDGFLYQHDAPDMLAHYVCEIFENNDLALKFSNNAREHALKTHDRDENTKMLIEIYGDVIEKKV